MDSKKFQNKYRTDSHRLKNFDYTSDAAYFITICTHNREHFFGKIIDGQMILNETGKIVHDEWKKTASIRKNIIVDEFIIMPNHIHGILIINNNDNTHNINDTDVLPNDTDVLPNGGRDVLAKRLYDGNHKNMSEISPEKNSISVIIRFIKRQSTIRIRKTIPGFKWQPNYYDHIIRNKSSLNRIRNYIKNNPKNWKNDSFYL